MKVILNIVLMKQTWFKSPSCIKIFYAPGGNGSGNFSCNINFGCFSGFPKFDGKGCHILEGADYLFLICTSNQRIFHAR